MKILEEIQSSAEKWNENVPVGAEVIIQDYPFEYKKIITIGEAFIQGGYSFITLSDNRHYFLYEVFPVDVK